MSSPDYSPYAREYAGARPGYPAGLFSFLASLPAGHETAWDCATGNGQAARELVNHFDRVIATDVSAEQLRFAFRHPRIQYTVASAGSSGLSATSVDLVTVASAVHWFDLQKFAAEVSRVVRPGGVLAVWSYHIGYVERPFDGVFLEFYRDVLAPYFPSGAKLVDQRYETLSLPGEPVPAPEFFVEVTWSLEQMMAFMGSWSGTQRYIAENSVNPADIVRERLASLWGDPERTQRIRWPLFLKVRKFT